MPNPTPNPTWPPRFTRFWGPLATALGGVYILAGFATGPIGWTIAGLTIIGGFSWLAADVYNALVEAKANRDLVPDPTPPSPPSTGQPTPPTPPPAREDAENPAERKHLQGYCWCGNTHGGGRGAGVPR